MAVAEVLEDEDARVVGWKLERLTELGLDPDTAEWIALSDVDWHDAERLIRNGCRPELVAEILT